MVRVFARIIVVLLAVPLVVFSTQRSAGAADVRLLTTASIGIPVGEGGGGIAVDTELGRLYMSNSQGDLWIIDTATNLTIASVRTGRLYPIPSAVDSVHHRVYLSSDSSDESVLTILNGITYERTATAAFPGWFGGVVVNAATDTAYIRLPSGVVAALNGADGSIRSSIGVGRSVGAIAVDEATNTVYVTVHTDSATSIAVVDGASNIVRSTTLVPAQIGGDLLFDRSRNVLYTLTNPPPGVDGPVDLVVLDATTFAVVDSVELPHLPTALALDSSGHLWVRTQFR